MIAAKVQGDFDQAHTYAITEAEREAIEVYKGRVHLCIGGVTEKQEAAAAIVQARIRGSLVREQQQKQKIEQAAILVQKSYRGHSERDNQEEQRRLTWLQCVSGSVPYSFSLPSAVHVCVLQCCFTSSCVSPSDGTLSSVNTSRH